MQRRVSWSAGHLTRASIRERRDVLCLRPNPEVTDLDNRADLRRHAMQNLAKGREEIVDVSNKCDQVMSTKY